MLAESAARILWGISSTITTYVPELHRAIQWRRGEFTPNRIIGILLAEKARALMRHAEASALMRTDPPLLTRTAPFFA